MCSCKRTDATFYHALADAAAIVEAALRMRAEAIEKCGGSAPPEVASQERATNETPGCQHANTVDVTTLGHMANGNRVLICGDCDAEVIRPYVKENRQ